MGKGPWDIPDSPPPEPGGGPAFLAALLGQAWGGQEGRCCQRKGTRLVTCPSWQGVEQLVLPRGDRSPSPGPHPGPALVSRVLSCHQLHG